MNQIASKYEIYQLSVSEIATAAGKSVGFSGFVSAYEKDRKSEKPAFYKLSKGVC